MLLFELRKLEQEVQRHILRLLNNHRAELDFAIDEARVEQRANLTIAVFIVPSKDGKPIIEEAFTAVSKDFCSNGISLIVREQFPYGELLLGLPFGDSDSGEPELSFIQCKVRHQQPLTEGIVQLGLQVRRLLDREEYPELAVLRL